MNPFLRQFTPEVLLPKLQDLLAGPGTGTVKVLHLGVGNMYGGIETTLVNIALKRGLMPRVAISMAICFPGKLQQNLEKAGITPHLLGPIRFRYPWTIWQARRALGRLLAKLKPDIVISHSCWTQAALGPTIRRAGVKLVTFMHSTATHSWFEWLASFTRPHHVIANSRFTASTLGKLFPGIPTTIIFEPGCDIPELEDKAKTRASMRAAFNCPETRKVILMAARFDPYKGHALLLDALARLNPSLDWECWIVGGAQQAAEKALELKLKAQGERLKIGNRLRFLGHRGNVLYLCAAADVFCQPNTGPEPFGHVFVEAQAMGCPVVTTAMGGPLENVEQGTHNRLVVRPDAALVAEALEDLLASREPVGT
jgi:glycosyltransferase involved in cell wall biosynthesis